jgi:ribosomal protein S18 acetylase RimI-like enzyme
MYQPTQESTQPPARRVQLRRATLGDAALIAKMHALSWVSTYRGMLPDRFLDLEVYEDRESYWHAQVCVLETGAGNLLIAEIDGQPIGFVCMLAPDNDNSVLIDNLHAIPGFKGAGAGSAMLDSAQQWARARGARSMYLYVLETNLAAIGFYEARGWRLAGREEDEMGGIDIMVLRYVFPLD